MTNMLNNDPFLLFFGTFYVVIGLSIFLAQKPWRDFIELFIENDSLSLVLGILTLPISLFIIFFYNNWDGIGPTALMVLGYIGLLKALILLLRPKWMQNFLGTGYIQKYLWIDGLSGILLGAGLLLL
ncbi:MAG: hypothetical protein KDI46_05835 [Alphaproteobacteria bacterium]|nr:hypothetical protein [Alphaproteobacteria bacterium]